MMMYRAFVVPTDITDTQPAIDTKDEGGRHVQQPGLDDPNLYPAPHWF